MDLGKWGGSGCHYMELSVSWGDQLEICAGGYLTKSAANPGAGDLLMGFLGSVILSFAFSLFRQRKVSM